MRWEIMPAKNRYATVAAIRQAGAGRDARKRRPGVRVGPGAGRVRGCMNVSLAYTL